MGNKGKISVTTQLEDSKALANAESMDRSSLLTKYKMMATDLENLREKLENENMRKSDALKALSKAQAEIQLWKSRYETEGMGRVEELEAARGKLQAKIVESEELVDVLTTKVANAEKSKTRMTADLDDISMEYERVHAAALITEKRGKNFDKVLGEWQSKAADVAAEVAASQDEGRNYSSELFRLKAATDEAVEQLDIVKRENKNLADEIKDLLDQLGEGGRSIHDLDKQRRRLEQEKEELQAALEEAEGTLEQEENKVLRAQLELGQVKQEIDRRVAEKEEEFNNTRKNHQRAMESMSASLEAEQKAAALSGEVEESKALLDSADRAKRQLDLEIADGRNAVNNMQVINGRDMTAKRGLEGSIHTIQAEVDAMLQAAKNAEEKSKKAMVDAARLADELRAEQDHAAAQASAKQSLANELAQLEGRLSDAEAAAARGGKAAMAKLESKIRDLEAELANTQARTGESAKAYQRAERKCKELVFSSGEDKKNQDRMSDLAAKLQSKIKTYKQQIEEAEEIAALNLAKFRKAQQELEEAEERAKLASLI